MIDARDFLFDATDHGLRLIRILAYEPAAACKRASGSAIRATSCNGGVDPPSGFFSGHG
jgi:hypothetical protein